MLRGGVVRNYDLRWKFEYLWGRERFGLWSDPGDDTKQAKNQTKCELVKVHIEALNARTGHIHKVFTIDAKEFEEFQFQYVAFFNGAQGGQQVLTSAVVAAQLISTNFIHKIDITGNQSIIPRGVVT